MGKTTRFDIHENAPEGDITFCASPAKFAGATNTKRKANFGVTDREPQGTTFMGNKSHLNFPKANGSVMDRKDLHTTSGQGEYKPSSNAVTPGTSFTGRPGIGKSSPKKGSTINKSQAFRK